MLTSVIDLTLGNVFCPAPKHMIRLSARLENSDSTMKILSRGHPKYFIGVSVLLHKYLICGPQPDYYSDYLHITTTVQ